MAPDVELNRCQISATLNEAYYESLKEHACEMSMNYKNYASILLYLSLTKSNKEPTRDEVLIKLLKELKVLRHRKQQANQGYDVE
jgi:hypothetical protein